MEIISKKLTAFDKPIYVTQPILPDLSKLTEKLQEIWSAKWLTNGGVQQEELESRLRNYLKVPHLSLFNNGTNALLIACQSLELTGEVITTPFTFPATPHALTWNKLRPVFCDIDPFTMNLDPDKLESLISPETTAILAVHVYGTPCRVEALQEIARRRGLKLIYDAAHAFGVEIEGIGIGNFGDVSMFSMHATKLFHSGEGGILVCSDAELDARIRLLRNFGIKNEEEVVLPGINGKLNELQAALGLLVFDCLEEERYRRQLLRQVYYSELRDVAGITLQYDQPNTKSSLQYFVIRIDEALFGHSRDELYLQLKKYNVFARKYFNPLCSDYPHYRELPSANPTNLPVAQRIVRQVLCLPLHSNVSEEQALMICKMIKVISHNKF